MQKLDSAEVALNRLFALAYRAAQVGGVIEITNEPNGELRAAYRGGFRLTSPEGYDLHLPGVSIAFLEEQIAELEREALSEGGAA